MEIQIKMKIEEFEEFLDWKKEKRKYARELNEERRRRLLLAEKVLFAVELDYEKEEHYIVRDQDHMDELAEMASEMLDE